MFKHRLLKIVEMTLLAVAVSLVMMLVLNVLQHPQLIMTLASVGWNR